MHKKKGRNLGSERRKKIQTNRVVDDMNVIDKKKSEKQRPKIWVLRIKKEARVKRKNSSEDGQKGRQELRKERNDK